MGCTRRDAAKAVRVAVAIVMLVLLAARAQAAPAIANLHVEYRATPLGIDVERPRFGWQMVAGAGERGLAQAAYRIAVRDPKFTPSEPLTGPKVSEHPTPPPAPAVK